MPSIFLSRSVPNHLSALERTTGSSSFGARSGKTFCSAARPRAKMTRAPVARAASMSRRAAGTLSSVAGCFAEVSLMSSTSSAVVLASTVTGTAGGRSGSCTGGLLRTRLAGPVERRPVLHVSLAVVRQVVVRGFDPAREPDLLLGGRVREELAQHSRSERPADDERVQPHRHQPRPALLTFLVDLIELILPPLQDVARVLARTARHLVIGHPDPVAEHREVALLGAHRVRQILVDRAHVVAIAQLGDEREGVVVRPFPRRDV